MERLPQEIVLDILSRLPIPSLMQAKSVCRAWRCLILDPVLVNKHFRRMVENGPTFILQSDQPYQSQLYFGDYDGNVMITNKLSMPSMPNSHLVGSCNGLLCLSDPHRSFGLCIYNPFTKDYTELPTLTNNHSFKQNLLGFGFDPIAKEYKIVHLSYRFPSHILKSINIGRFIATPRSASLNEGAVHILTIGGQWRSLGTVPFHLRRQQSPPIVINGKLHWVCNPKRSNEMSNLIVSFDLTTELFQELPKPDCGNSSSANRRLDHMAVLGGCLSIACHDKDTKVWEIWVMKSYGVKESWSKEYSIEPYLPQILSEKYGDNDPRRLFLVKRMRVLCLLRSGEILLEYRNKAIVAYDPHCGTFKDLHLTFEEMPTYFKVLVHVSSLHWIHTFVNA